MGQGRESGVATKGNDSALASSPRQRPTPPSSFDVFDRSSHSRLRLARHTPSSHILTRPSPAARRREDAAWRSIVVLVFLGLKVEKGNLLAPFFFFLEARRKNELRPSTRFCFFAFVFFKRRKTPRGGLPPGSSSGDRHAGELLSREIPLSDENHEKRKVERYKK